MRLLEALRRGRWDDGTPVIDVADDVLAERIIPPIAAELCRAITQHARREHERDPMPSAQASECDNCGSGDVVHVLRWPDTAFRVCEGCTPADLLAVAEPLDDDDDLASDPMSASERARERGSLI